MKRVKYYLLAAFVMLVAYGLHSCVEEEEMVVLSAPVMEPIQDENITQTSVELRASFQANTIYEGGFYYSSTSDFTGAMKIKASINGNSFSTILDGLDGGFTYYVKAYIIGDLAEVQSEMLNFTTKSNVVPVLKTTKVSDIESDSAVSGGEILDNGGLDITSRGLCWSLKANPSVTDDKIDLGPSSKHTFSVTLSELSPARKYYIRAFATNGKGTAYGQQEEFTTEAALASVITKKVSSVTNEGASISSEVLSDGGTEITARGVCWSSSQKPSISDSKTKDGSGVGEYTSTISGLKRSTKYYVRAYVTNSKGTSYGDELSFTTDGELASVTTKEVTEITENSAKTGGEDIDDGSRAITAKGVCWGTEPSPDLEDQVKNAGSGSTDYTVTISGLTHSTKYYVRAYVTTEKGTSYGQEREFTTRGTLPVLTTKEVVEIDCASAIVHSEVLDAGGSDVTLRGVCWSMSHNPTISDSKTEDGSGVGEYTSAISGLTRTTKYYVRAYAKNDTGVNYGEELSFTTEGELAKLTTLEVTEILENSAKSGGMITDDGGLDVLKCGVCYGLTQNPSIDGDKTEDELVSSKFVSHLTNLFGASKYYIRAYVTNAMGTSYGAELEFLTEASAPSVEISEVSEITSTTAKLNANVISNGGSELSERGFCYGLISNPDISNSTKVAVGTSVGEYSQTVTGLRKDTKYYVRAYAINAKGIRYSTELNFITQADVPTISTRAISELSYKSFKTGGVVSDDGGRDVISRGVCWSTEENPTIDLETKTENGSGMGAYVSMVLGLRAETTYYLRAYASNSSGTGYGDQKIVNTPEGVVSELNTKMLSEITSSSALSGGEITEDGGYDVTQRGVCWAEHNSPSLEDNFTLSGEGSGEFESEITGLKRATVCYVRAYSITVKGTSYGAERAFTTKGELAQVETNMPSDITYNSVKVKANITDNGGVAVEEAGVCWGIETAPTIDDNKKVSDKKSLGEYELTIEGLSHTTNYYVRAYVKNKEGISYGNEESFTTLSTIASLTTSDVESITSSTAISGATVSDDGGAALSQMGVCWNETGSPSLDDNFTIDSYEAAPNENSFISSLTGLERATKYYMRAYAKKENGISYGAEKVFTTKGELAQVNTIEVLDMTHNTAKVKSKVIDDGGVSVVRGVCWSTTANPTISDSKTEDGEGEGEYESSLTGLSHTTTYYVRAYAKNKEGVSYGEQLQFTTDATLPVLSTGSLKQTSETSVDVIDSDVSDDGGSNVTARGVCWSLVSNPSLADSYSIDGSGSGQFRSSITGLEKGTTYYIRAYATNAYGTSYGEEKTIRILKIYLDEYGESHGYGIEVAGVVWAPVNCGYHSNKYEYGKLYQWGRKYGQGYDSDDATYPSGSNIVDGPVSNTTGNSPSNKDKFYKKEKFTHDWCSPQLSEWSSEYDPCPEGWRVPTTSELRRLHENYSSRTTNDGQSGRWFSGDKSYSSAGDAKVFFPAAGYRNYYGSASGRGSSGDYWSSSVSGSNAYDLSFDDDNMGVSSTSNLATGSSVRCVEDL